MTQSPLDWEMLGGGLSCFPTEWMYKFNASLLAKEAKPVGFVCALWTVAHLQKMLVTASSEEKEILSKDAELIWRYIMDDESCDGIEKVENKGVSICFFWFVGPSQYFKDCVPQHIHLLSLVITILVRITHLFLPVGLLFGWLSPPATRPAHTLSVGFEVV